MKKDWHQRWIPKVEYQQTNYTKVENSNPEDKKSIVSINTEASNFAIRNQGEADEEENEEDVLF